MSTINLIGLIAITLGLVLTNLASIYLLSYKKQFYMKSFFIGFLCYLIARGFILPFASIFFAKALPEFTMTINILLLSFACVYVKKVVYRFTLIKDAPLSHYLSAGVGEAFLEIMLSITSIFMNAASYALKLHNGSMVEFFSQVYTLAEIEEISSTFLSIPMSYYVYLFLSVFVIFFIHAYTSIQIQKKVKTYRILSVCIGLFVINTILPSYSYPLYIGLILVLGCGYLYSIKSKKN